MTVYSGSKLQVSAQESKRLGTGIVEDYIGELEKKGYENVNYELSYLITFAEEHHLPYRPSVSNDFDIKDTFIKMYDYYATYYSVQVGEKDYLFKSEDEANSFIQTINKYDGQDYTIKTTTKIVERETEKQEINDTIEAKKQEYEEEQERIKAEAEAEARRKEEQAEQTKSTTTYSSDLSSLQSYARDLVINNYGWSESDFNALVNLWNKESGWNPNSHNSSSGAHGIPQALPASKMASEGGDYYTNGETQIRWGLKYIAQRYGTPSNAWGHWQSVGWY